MGDAGEGRWVDEPILPELAAPPDDLIQVRGAQVVRVHDIDNPNPRLRGHTEAVVIAWAPIPGGGWAGLFCWTGGWQQAQPPRKTTGAPRWAWCRVVEGRVQAWTPARPLVEAEEHEWHGYHVLSDFAEAIRLAAATLPEHLREAALTPMAQTGTDQQD